MPATIHFLGFPQPEPVTARRVYAGSPTLRDGATVTCKRSFITSGCSFETPCRGSPYVERITPPTPVQSPAITLSGRQFRVVRHGDAHVVIVRGTGRSWRLAGAVSERVMAGLRVAAVVS